MVHRNPLVVVISAGALNATGGIMKQVKDLKPNPKNPRKIKDQKLEMLKRTLAEYGDLGGFVFNIRSGQLVGGHQRAKVFSQDKVIAIERKYDPPTAVGTVAEGYVEFNGERFSYREVDWAEPKEKAANIAANKGVGEWDMPLLAGWMQELGDLDFDLDLTLFDELERMDLDLSLDKSLSKPDTKTQKYILELEFPDEQSRKDEYERLLQEGLIVRFK